MDYTLHHKAGNTLGEGPLWDPQAESLVWVDIPENRVFRLQQGSDRPDVVALPEPPGSIALLGEGRYLVAAGRSLYRAGFDQGTCDKVMPVKGMDPASALNDGKADRQGRFVFGSKHVEENEPRGALFSFDGSSLQELHAPFVVFNGPAFNRAGDRIYFADSPTGRIFCARYDLDNGRMETPEIFAQVPEKDGYPDGMTVDAEDFLWNAHWDGFRLTRYRPDGAVDKVVELPLQRPTSICFAGPELTTMIVSSAAVEGQADGGGDIANGDLLRLQADVPGLPETVVQAADL